MLLLAACGSGETTSPRPDGAAPDAALLEASLDASVEAAAPRYGLEARSPNPTCKPFPSVDEAPARLSQTGCFDPADPRKPAATLIPYDVRAPLWSDGADKWRAFALPDGATVHVEPDGDWTFPVGTVLTKSFAFAGRFVETRLLVRFDADTWVGYSYKWRADQSDADLLADNVGGYREPILGVDGAPLTWHFPSRSECLQCHTKAAGYSLGPRPRS